MGSQFVACRDEYHDTWSVECGSETVAVLWYLDEESHDRHPFENAESNAKLLASASDLRRQVAEMDIVEALLQRGWSVSWKGRYWEWKDHQGCSGTEYQSGDLRKLPSMVYEWVRKNIPLRPMAAVMLMNADWKPRK